jgi:peptidoglycan/LPS O-acetylase OafA/YrhL
LPQALGQFFLRRFRRIFPPYWAAFGLTLLLTLLLTAVAPQLVDLEEGGTFSHLPRLAAITPVEWLSNLTLTESWRYHLVGPGRQGFVLGQAWSLCYEEQFYALCGLLLFLAPRRFFSGTAVITVVVLLLQPIHFIYPGAMRGFFFDGYWLLFALGLLVYYRLNYPPVPLDGLLSLVFCLCPVMFLLSTFGVLNEPRHAGLGTLSYELTIGSLFSLLLLFMRRWDGALMSSKLLWPLAFCGQMCYSLYLIHWPIAEVIGLGCFLLGVHSLVATLLITVPLTMATSIAAAWLFHRLVERHFLNPPSVSARPRNKG